ncbi:MAG: Crp/Fnr family transcriptional regulator [Rhodopila sp.]
MALELVPMRPDERTLADIHLLRDVPHDVVKELSRGCRWNHYDEGQVIIQYQESDKRIFFVVHGKVRAVHYSPCGREVIFRSISRGDTFGELSAIDGHCRSASVVAATSTLAASMTDTQFWQIVRQHESVNAALLRRLVGLVRMLTERIVEFSTMTVRNRIHVELLRLAHEAGSDHNVARIHPVPTHGDIASRIATHREAVTRELNELARAGLVERKNGTIIIRDVGALVDMVHEASGRHLSDVTRTSAILVPPQGHRSR